MLLRIHLSRKLHCEVSVFLRLSLLDSYSSHNASHMIAHVIVHGDDVMQSSGMRL